MTSRGRTACLYQVSTRCYFHGTRIESDWQVGSPVAYHSTRAGEVAVHGVIREAARPRRLSYTWNVRYDPEHAGEQPSLVTWEIEPAGNACKLTLAHEFTEASKTSREVRSGWNAILSSLKSLLESWRPASPCR